MTEQELYDEVISSLGGTLVDVELALEDVNAAFKRAKRRYIQRGTNNWNKEFFTLNLEKGKVEYDVPSDIHTIVKIIRTKAGLFNNEDLFSVAVFQDMFQTSGPIIEDFLSYEMTLQRIEKWQRYMAYDIQFIHNQQNNKLKLLNDPKRDELSFLECYRNLSDEEYRDKDWIIRWTVAESKEMLGMAYRKFSSLAAPTGEVQLDGASLIQEAKQEKEELLLEIENLVDGDTDYIEISFG